MRQDSHFIQRIGATADWVDHFERSLARKDVVGEQDCIVLTPEERDAIATSVQEFQLGESSEGRHLIRAAQRHAKQTGDQDYVAAMRLFIAEENRHARELGRVLDGAGIGRVSATAPDTVFRMLRRGAGLELSIVVLVTAEIIAKVYYAALRDATDCRPLRQLCEQILRDEHHHVIFQSQRIALLRAKRSRWSIAIRVALHRFLLAGTCLVVWRRHGRAMDAGGVTFSHFWRETGREMNHALAHMNPRNYPALTESGARRATPRSGNEIDLRPVASLAAPRLPADVLQLTSEDVT